MRSLTAIHTYMKLRYLNTNIVYKYVNNKIDVHTYVHTNLLPIRVCPLAVALTSHISAVLLGLIVQLTVIECNVLFSLGESSVVMVLVTEEDTEKTYAHVHVNVHMHTQSIYVRTHMYAYILYN